MNLSVLPITQYGDEILDKKTVPVNKIDSEILELVSNMFETMEQADGVGLAANQVGSNKSIFIIDLTEVKGMEKFGRMTFINPKITFRSEEKVVMEEGCLSLPGLRNEVERPKIIKITYQDLSGQKKETEADDFFSRVIQHEYDHLNGIFFTQRIEDDNKKEIKDYLLKIKNREVKCDYPVTPKPVQKKR